MYDALFLRRQLKTCQTLAHGYPNCGRRSPLTMPQPNRNKRHTASTQTAASVNPNQMSLHVYTHSSVELTAQIRAEQKSCCALDAHLREASIGRRMFVPYVLQRVGLLEVPHLSSREAISPHSKRTISKRDVLCPFVFVVVVRRKGKRPGRTTGEDSSRL